MTVQKRFTRCSGCLLNVLRAFNLCLAYMGKAYFCNKLIFESCSNASASCIYLSFLISAWLATTVSIVSVVFCRRICQRISDNLLSHEQQLNKTTFVSHLMSGESMHEKLVKLMQVQFKIAHMPQKEFKTIKWLPMKQRFNQYRYFKKQCPHYLNKVFVKTTKPSLSLRNSYHKHKLPLCTNSK